MEPRVPLCTPRTWSFAFRGSRSCIPCSRISACRAGRGCTRAVTFHLAVRAGLARPAVVFQLAVRARAAAHAALFQLAVGARVALHAALFSPCRGDTGCTPCTGVFAFRAGIAYVPPLSISARTNVCAPRRANTRVVAFTRVAFEVTLPRNPQNRVEK